MKKEKSEKGICCNSYHTNNIEIDCIIFCFEDKKLKVLLIKNENDVEHASWKLPSSILKEGESILEAAQKIVKKHIPSDDFFLEQLKAFDYTSLLSFQYGISIGCYAMITNNKRDFEEKELHSDVAWVEINDTAGLDKKHTIILDFGIKELRKNMCCSALGFNLLPEKFTLLQIIQLYEEILGIEINKTNFRRKILQRKLVRSLDEKEEGVSYRAPKFYSLNMSKYEMFWNMKFNF
ncbi:NUDIX hydrolase [Flavobacterium ustbae]|uniref:NUDIX hydrolase n=1 Tax=Flavobacterium ustbae TaxID=2488790 RepID=UPI000F7B17D7|nr:NUDIX hydrolase [Flavobacterium ustbae]